MPYINSRGEILESRPLWSISTFTDMVYGFFRMASLFFQTLFMMNPDKKSRSSRSSPGSSGRRPPPDPPRRRMGGFGGGTGGVDMGTPCFPGGG
ncbi:selenoprotein K-like [Ornithodoros turicata]|uniref:Putative selenoprotein k n=1 Tax=Ornithodoros turicata TaxID=34597 RepID=A0A2R5LFH9_9ACAR